MANTHLARPLIDRALPQAGASRWLAYALLAVAGSLLLTISAQIKVPFWPVPATLQTLAVFIIAGAYGRNLAVATVALYLAQGAVGLPVFTGGAGLAYMAGPTGGFLAGFLVAAAVIGAAADRGWSSSMARMSAATAIGGALLLALGWGYLSTLIGTDKAWVAGVQPFLLGEATKVVLAAAFISATGSLAARR